MRKEIAEKKKKDKGRKGEYRMKTNPTTQIIIHVIVPNPNFITTHK